MNSTQVFAFAQVTDEQARKLVYQEIKEGRSRFGIFDQGKKSLRDHSFGKNAFLLRIKKGDWIVHVNMPHYGRCVAVQVAGEYQFDDGISCSWGADFNNVIQNDPATIIEFDRKNINVLPSVNLSPMRRGQRVSEVEDFLQSMENLKAQKYSTTDGQTRAAIHLKNRISTLLPKLTEAIHVMNKSKEFERFLTGIFSKMPNTLSVIQNGFGWRSDNGADLIVEFKSPMIGVSLTSKLVVQAKSYEGSHYDLKAIDQIVQGITEYQADGGLLITTAEKTEELESYILKKSLEMNKPIDLIAGDDVTRLVLRYAPEMLVG